MTLRTPLCDLLGITHPIVQSGMGGVAGPELVAEVSRAGGLGIIAALHLDPDQVREAIRRVRAVTDRPFGVNQFMPDALRPPADPATIPADTVAEVQSTLNGFRARLGLPAATARPPAVPDLIDAAFEVIVEERVPVWSIGLGRPSAEQVRRAHARSIKVMAMVTTVEDARTVAQAGVDVVVAQGGEAGGHRSTWTKRRSAEEACVGTLALVPQVADAVRVPVVAAGGIADGRGLVAALALGAAGVLLGTRFVATRESTAPEFQKKTLLERESDATVVTDAVTGLWARYLRNTYTTEYGASGAPVFPALLQQRAAQDIFGHGAKQSDPAWYPMATGQSVGLIRDLPGAGEVVETIARDARAILDGLARLGR
ncbi:MAG TPA: nitronate monooxygenase family protein [Candidatus Binatia bacterium]|nr:nitronate monooxygenase family protein [Candidatus Binatia bacterium]